MHRPGSFLLLVSLAACGADEHVPPGSPDAALPVDAVPPDAAPPLVFVAGPTLTMAPNPEAPLAGRLELATSRPTRVTIAIDRPGGSFAVELDDLATEHVLPVLGFRPDTTHAVTVTVTAADGETLAADPFEVVTAPLPAGFPTFTVGAITPGAMEPGVTILPADRYLVILDEDGEVTWYADTIQFPGDVQRTPEGTLLFLLANRRGAVEMDMLGTVIRRWHPSNRSLGEPGSIPVATDSFHHDIELLPDGDFLTLGSERRAYDDYPTSETDPTPQTSPQLVIGDVVLAFAPDGTITQSWSLLDLLDPYRVGYDSFGSYWFSFYAPEGGIDWSHGNAVIRDPADGGLIVSLRHQDALVKLDATGALVWILGTHDNWGAAFAPYLLTPVGAPFEWPFHQHAPELLPDGNLMVFDNGNHGVSPPTPPPGGEHSRAVEYAIDPVRMEIRQVWSYDAGDAIFSATLGDVDHAPVTGNVIVTFGASRRIIEVTRDEPAVVVFDVSASTSIYRSERLPSLYP